MDVKGSADFHLIVTGKSRGKNISCFKDRNCDGLICLYYFIKTLKPESLFCQPSVI